MDGFFFSPQAEIDMRMDRLAKRRVAVRFNRETGKFEVRKNGTLTLHDTIEQAASEGEK